MEQEIMLSAKFEPTNIIIFYQSNNKPILELHGNGDIFVKGRLSENDKEVVDALREFLITQGILK